MPQISKSQLLPNHLSNEENIMSTNTNWNVQEWADQCLTDSKRISSTSKSESKSSKRHRK